MEFFTIQLLIGLSYGLLLFLLSAGLTLIFSMMGVLNFAHASFYMLGAYLAYQFSRWFGYWPALVLAPLLVGGFGALIQRYGLRRVQSHGQGHVPELLFTFGLSYLCYEAVQLLWGRAAVPYGVPAELDGALFQVYGTAFPAYRGFMMAVALVVLAMLWLALTRTRVGLVIQAALRHPAMVEALGHNLARIHLLVFAGGAALAGLAGVIGGNAFVTEPAMAAQVGPLLFVVTVIGGLGSLTGAFVASLLIGLLQTFAVAFDASLARLLEALGLPLGSDRTPHPLLDLTLAQAAPILPYLLLVLVLILRPRGLMGTRE